MNDRTPDSVTVTVPIKGQYPVYPQADAHTWGAFAYLAIEMGGYGDLEVVNPYNGVSLNAPVFKSTDNGYTALRLLIDEMEKVDFLRIKAAEPKPVRELVAADFGGLDAAVRLGYGVVASILTKRLGFVVTAEQAKAADPFAGIPADEDYGQYLGGACPDIP